MMIKLNPSTHSHTWKTRNMAGRTRTKTNINKHGMFIGNEIETKMKGIADERKYMNETAFLRETGTHHSHCDYLN